MSDTSIFLAVLIFSRSLAWRSSCDGSANQHLSTVPTGLIQPPSPPLPTSLRSFPPSLLSFSPSFSRHVSVRPAWARATQLMLALIVTAVMTSSKQYLGMTWSLWLACLSFLFAPFWFNPLSFHWGKVVQDYKLWMRWMTGTGGNSSTSWEVGLWDFGICCTVGVGFGVLVGADWSEFCFSYA